jgi:hypothetical protein
MGLKTGRCNHPARGVVSTRKPTWFAGDQSPLPRNGRPKKGGTSQRDWSKAHEHLGGIQKALGKPLFREFYTSIAGEASHLDVAIHYRSAAKVTLRRNTEQPRLRAVRAR